jgi:ABC-type phosphate transport system substrate-binding protein
MKLRLRHIAPLALCRARRTARSLRLRQERAGRAQRWRAGPSGPSLVSLDGSSTVFPISEAVAEEFQKAEKSIRVTVGISGTGGGFQKFCRGEIDISDASRPISATEVEACKKAGVEYIELPIAYDGIAIAVNPKAAGPTRSPTAELKTLWAPDAQGKVDKWSTVRKGWPDRENSPVRRRRRLGHLRLLHRGDQRQGQGQPRRLHVE